LRIKNHFIDVSVVHGAGVVVGLAGEPIGLEHNVKDVCEEDEKKNAN
jgi:hypothetical protein